MAARMCGIKESTILWRNIAHEFAVMYVGRVLEILPEEKVSKEAIHPYTAVVQNTSGEEC